MTSDYSWKLLQWTIKIITRDFRLFSETFTMDNKDNHSRLQTILGNFYNVFFFSNLDGSLHGILKQAWLTSKCKWTHSTEDSTLKNYEIHADIKRSRCQWPFKAFLKNCANVLGKLIKRLLQQEDFSMLVL